MSRLLICSAAAVLALAATSSPGPVSRPKSPSPPPAPAPSASAPAVRVTLETIAVDRRGTWSAGSDVADLFPGSPGLLEKSLTLIGRQEGDPAREMLQIKTRVTPTLVPGAACRLRIEAETRRVIAGARAPAGGSGPDRKTTTVVLQEGEDKLVEVYSSSVTDGRIALKVRCGEPEGAQASDLRLVDFTVAIARGDADQPMQPLKSDSLQAMVGREATDLALFNLALPEGDAGTKRYRRERIEIVLSPVLISGGRIQVDFRLQGELATVAAASDLKHPIDHRQTLILASGETHPIDLTVRSSGPQEGWEVVRYRLEITGRF